MKFTLHSGIAISYPGFDAWVTTERGEVIGEGWAMDRHTAEDCAIRDAEFVTGGHLLRTPPLAAAA